MKRPGIFSVVAFLGVFALCPACSSQGESIPGDAEGSSAASGGAPLTSVEGLPGQASQVSADLEAMPDVVAKVNDAEITKVELVARAESIQRQMPAGSGQDGIDFYRRVLDDLIGTELLYQSSAERGHVPTEAEVDAQVAQIRARFPDPAQFNQVLEAQGMDEAKLRQMMSRELGIQKLIESELAAGVEVTAEEKQTFYQENTEQMKEPEQVRLSHILVGADENATPEQRELAKKKTEDIRSRAMAGEDFAALARENSDDPGSKANGGELPWVGRGDTVPPFEAAAFALSPGEISEVVETRYGYHVIKLAERKEGGTIPFEQAEAQIDQYLRQEAIRNRVQTEVDSLKAAGEVEIFI